MYTLQKRCFNTRFMRSIGDRRSHHLSFQLWVATGDRILQERGCFQHQRSTIVSQSPLYMALMVERIQGWAKLNYSGLSETELLKINESLRVPLVSSLNARSLQVAHHSCNPKQSLLPTEPLVVTSYDERTPNHKSSSNLATQQDSDIHKAAKGECASNKCALSV